MSEESANKSEEIDTFLLQTCIIAHIRLYKKENPIHSIEIEKQFDVSGSFVRDAVRHAWRQGIPICNDKGYYLAESFEDFRPTLEDLESRALSLMNTISLFRQHFGILKNKQESFF